ncbi:MAG: hypothetical protein R2752_09325 [Vicinamibacterales bacterium]
MPRRAVILAALAVAVAGVLASAPFLRAARMLVVLTGRPARAAEWLTPRGGVTTEDVDVPTRAGTIRARIYRPPGVPARHLLVVPGVHAGGLDEPRMSALLTRLAMTGSLVVGLPVPDLREYRITPAATDDIEDAAQWMSATPALAPAGRIGLVGVSFGGGLAVAAAGRPSLAGRLSAVVSIGGYGDLPRVLRFLCTGRLPDGTARAPHDFGLAVLAYGGARHLVPADQVEAFTRALRTFLDASSAQTTDEAEAARLLQASREMTGALPSPARDLMQLVLARDVATLGARLLPIVPALGGDPALSPDRSPAPAAPVFLLHGTDDPVIPEDETVELARDLTARGATVHWLLTPALHHADIESGLGAADAWALVRFWSGVVAAVR